MKPLGTKLFIDPEKAEMQTETGLFLPMNAQKNTGFGEVTAIGIDVVDLKVGDRVFYDLRNTIEINQGGKRHHMTEEQFVLAKQEGADANV